MSIYLECNRCCEAVDRMVPRLGPGDPCPNPECGGHIVKTTDARELECDNEEEEEECNEENS